jgi:hypothetical protein
VFLPLKSSADQAPSNPIWNATIFDQGGPGAELDCNPALWLPPVPVQKPKPSAIATPPDPTKQGALTGEQFDAHAHHVLRCVSPPRCWRCGGVGKWLPLQHTEWVHRPLEASTTLTLDGVDVSGEMYSTSVSCTLAVWLAPKCCDRSTACALVSRMHRHPIAARHTRSLPVKAEAVFDPGGGGGRCAALDTTSCFKPRRPGSCSWP